MSRHWSSSSSDSSTGTVIYIFGALLIAALGFGLLWLGTRMLKGVRFVFRFLFEKVRNWRKRAPAQASAGGERQGAESSKRPIEARRSDPEERF